MMRGLFALLVVLWPFATPAETIAVGSGEHDGFTRLTFQVGMEFDWAIGRTDTGYELRIDLPDLSYDTARVFNRIPRTRLQSLSPGLADSSLRLETECDCHANAYLFRPGILVVDLKDGPPRSNSRFEDPLPESAGVMAKWRPRPRPYTKARYNWLDDIDLAQAAQESMIGLAIETAAGIEEQTNAVQLHLAEQLGRAATQGIVELSVPVEPANALVPPTPQMGESELAHTSPMPARAPTAAAHMRMTATTAIDQANGRQQGPELTSDGKECPDPERFAIASWGDDRPAAIQIAEARQGLVGEFDRVDRDAVLKLVRLYLYFGFGAEAKQLLRELRIENADPALTTLAGILDNLDGAAGVAGKASCDSIVALWALLADPQTAAKEPIDKGAVMLAFSGLPLHLRLLIGPRLVNRLIELNDSASARQIGDMILRAPEHRGPDISLMEAEVALADGHPASAIDKAEAIISDGGPMTAEAALLLVETSFAQNSGLPEGTYDLVSSLAREQKGSPLEPRLQRARALAAAIQDDYKTAFGISTELKDPSIADATSLDLWSNLLGRADDETFLTHAIQRPAKSPENLDTVGVANRLFTLGFPEQARTWLSQGEVNDDRTRLAMAKVELGLGNAREALRLSAGLKGGEADAMRGRALEKLGNLALAAEAYARAGDQSSRISALWRSGDLGGLRTENPDDPRLALAPEPQDTLVELQIGPDKPLAHGRALIEASSQTRAVLEELLQDQRP